MTIVTAAMINKLYLEKKIQKYNGIKLLAIPTPTVANTETAPPFTA